MIPKIIHHFAPENKEHWHPLWNKCLDSWFLHFQEPEYEHKFWYNDNSENDDIAKFIKNEYFEYKKIYDEFPSHIMKIDLAKYLVIHKYGGLYIDMDIFCYKNFYHMLNKDVILLEILTENGSEIENCMFGGKANSYFYKKCADNLVLQFKKNKTELLSNYKKKYFLYEENNYILLIHNITGSDNMTNTYNNHNINDVFVLNYEQFNYHHLYYDHSLFTRHMRTGLWGKEDITSSYKNKKKLSYNFYLKNIYLKHSKIDIDHFDFYKNYLEQ